MRVALISDIHGNEIALEAVLADIERSGVDRIVCLGDVATLGPRPREVIARLRALGCPCILGNHDDFLLRPGTIHDYTETPVVVDAVAWCGAQITDDDRAFLRTFVRFAEIPLGRGRTLLAYHGSMRSHTDEILPTTPIATLDRMLDGRRAPVMAGGHTHVQMMRQYGDAVVVNPGSVGLAFAEHAAGQPPTILPLAEYAIIDATGADIRVELERLTLDWRALAAAIAATDNPVAAYQIQQYEQAGRASAASSGSGEPKRTSASPAQPAGSNTATSLS